MLAGAAKVCRALESRQASNLMPLAPSAAAQR